MEHTTPKPKPGISDIRILIGTAYMLYETMFVLDAEKLNHWKYHTLAVAFWAMMDSYGDSIVAFGGPLGSGSLFLVFGLRPEDALHFQVLCSSDFVGLYSAGPQSEDPIAITN